MCELVGMHHIHILYALTTCMHTPCVLASALCVHRLTLLVHDEAIHQSGMKALNMLHNDRTISDAGDLGYYVVCQYVCGY